MSLTYAVGDIHGCLDKLRGLLLHCKMHAAGRPSAFVFVCWRLHRSRTAIVRRHRLFDRYESAARRQSRDADGKPRSDCARGNRLNLDTGAVYGGPLFAGGGADELAEEDRVMRARGEQA